MDWDKKMSINWDEYFMMVVNTIKQKSKDKATKVGAVIVGPDNEIRSVGYNGFPRGVDDNIEVRHERPEKYLWTECAERNAIYNAARMGTALKGCRIYIDTIPCTNCARGIVQVGINEVIVNSLTIPRWEENQRKSLEILAEGKVPWRVIKTE